MPDLVQHNPGAKLTEADPSRRLPVTCRPAAGGASCPAGRVVNVVGVMADRYPAPRSEIANRRRRRVRRDSMPASTSGRFRWQSKSE